MSNETYLVLCATGRQGSAVVDALIAKNVTSIIASSRNPESLTAKRGDTVRTVKADMEDTDSIVSAITESGASRVWFTTDWYSISKPTRAKEARLGYNVIDAVKRCSGQVHHVVYNSGAYDTTMSEKIGEIWSKADIEAYMEQELASTSTTWAVLKPVVFLENLDDSKNGNPLTKGYVKMLTKPDCKVKYIGAADIGKGSVELLLKPEEYAGKKIDAVTCEYTGPQLAQILSEVSGTKCKYAVSVPRFVLWIFVNNLYHLANWVEAGVAYEHCDIEAYRKIVPDYQDARDWFAQKGQWSDGEKFASLA